MRNSDARSRRATDVYLLTLAVEKRGRFVTLDRHVPLESAAGASARNLVVLGWSVRGVGRVERVPFL